MANTITGKIAYIGPIQQIPSKNGGNPFVKREIVIDSTRFDPYTGERDKFENFPLFEFSGDKCSDLDNFQVNDVVTVSFDIQGRKWIDAEGKTKYINSIRGYKIEARQVGQRTPQPAPQQQVVYQHQQPAYNPPMPPDFPPPPQDEPPF